MKLTGKAKEDFLNYYWSNHIDPLLISIRKRSDLEEFFNTIQELMQNALIIEFFDSVGYKILPCHGVSGWYCELKNYNNKEFGNYKCHLVVNKGVNDFDTRQEAISQAIITANKLYNETN